MEQWERDYIDAVLESKKDTENVKGHVWAYEEGYDSSRWTEMTRPDGTKYYVPKENAFIHKSGEKQRKPQRKRKYMVPLRTFGRGFLAAAALLGMFLKATDGNIQDGVMPKTGRSYSLESMIQGQILGGTYINGIGFAEMMHFFEDMQLERHSFLNEVAQSIGDLSEVNTEKWEDIFSKREQSLEQLKYAEAYTQYVQAQKDTFEEEKELLVLLRSGAEAHTVLEVYYQLAAADRKLSQEAMTAMDKNGVEYILENDGLKFWYKNY